MEEILASIRRIIAEGERDAQQSSGQPDRAESTAAAPSRAATAEKPTELGHAEVLVLTEMVQDDGSVVSLQAAAESTSAPPDDGAVDRLLRAGLLADPAPGSPAVAAPPMEIAAIAAVFAPPPAPAETAAAQPPPPAPVAKKPTPADTLPEKLPAWLSPTPPPTDEERIPVSSESFKKPELVSEEALAASTAALAQLAQSVTRTREPAPGASKTLEEVVRESVEPLLKQWLDQHLPRIVERMVREAIDRVVRRVE